MKNKLLALLSVILVSCSPAYAGPAYAQTNNVGLELTLCEELSNFSFTVMKVRQGNVSLEEALSVAPIPITQAEKQVKPLVDAIIKQAYDAPRVSSQENKQRIADAYSKHIYLMCVGDSKWL